MEGVSSSRIVTCPMVSRFLKFMSVEEDVNLIVAIKSLSTTELALVCKFTVTPSCQFERVQRMLLLVILSLSFASPVIEGVIITSLDGSAVRLSLNVAVALFSGIFKLMGSNSSFGFG